WTAMLTRSPRNLTAGDLDANGFDDIFFPGPTVFRGAPDPQTEPSYHVAPPPPHDADPVADADHDGDGYLDLAQAGYWYPGPHSPAIPSPVIVMSGEDELAISALAR